MNRKLDIQAGTLSAIDARQQAELNGIRALLDTLLALDPDNEKNWGRLSPVTRPEDLRTIYLCPHHIHDFAYPYTATGSSP